MLRQATIVFLLASSVLIYSVNCVGHYTIVGSKNIRPHSDYQVSVTLHDKAEPTKVKISIVDEADYKNEREITVQPNKTELVLLHLDDLKVNNHFKLVAEGLSGIIFKNESALNVESKNVSLFTQTDKAIYKPGETVKFRVLVLDSLLRPAQVKKGDLLVYINDAQKNRIKQWKDVDLVKGVFSSELQLSDLPVLGDWDIKAEVGEESKTKTIEIAEYVLPKFEVTVDSPNDFSAKDGKIRLIVRSKYTYGKFVKGEATVSLTPKSYNRWTPRYYSGDAIASDAIVKTIKVDGKGSAEFDIVRDLNIEFQEYEQTKSYSFKATVIEELTGRNESVSKDITIHKTKYKFTQLNKSNEFRAGLPVEFTLKVTHHDDSAVPVNENTKEIVVGRIENRYSENPNSTYFKFELDPIGSVNIRIPTATKQSGFYLQVKYLDEEADLGYFYPRSEREPERFSVKVISKKPTLGEKVFVEVESQDEIDSFTYQVISHRRVVHSDTVQVPARKYHVFHFVPTFEVAPKAQIIAYYFKGDEIISARTDVEVRENLNNYVKLKLSAQRANPGQEIDIDVSTNPQSYVGLVGVDQSVLLLKQNEDLTKDAAFSEIENYPYSVHQKRHIESYSDPNYYNHWRDFRYLDVILFTNAEIQENLYIRKNQLLTRGPGTVYATQAFAIADRSEAVYFGGAAGMAGPPQAQAGVAASQPPPPPPPRVRKEFPETWLWEAITDDSFNGTQTLHKKVPDTITSWVISAFAVSPETGLGLLKTPRKLEVFQPFFVSLNLPYDVKRGEILNVPVIVFNYLEDDVQADVVLHNEDDEFDFVYANEEGNTELKSEASRSKSVNVVSNNGASTSFLIKPKKVGSITIKVTATSPLAGDAVERILPVEPEGVTQFVNKAVFVDLRDAPSFETSVKAEFPANAVPDSERLEVNVVGDILGGTIKNLHNLIRLPYGCGEQNMLNFVPNIVVLNYLKATQQSNPAIEEKAKKYTESGYQRQLTYRHDDGSFSVFGKADRNGSTWLTTFVAKSFRQAASHIHIEESVIEKALTWLSKNQAQDGSFPEVGHVSHQAMQGGAGKGVALTAYVLTAFLENKEKFPAFQSTIDKAINNIATNLKGVEDTYILAVATYALQLADHSSKKQVLDQFVAKTSEKDGLKWWKKSNEVGKESKTLNVEITAYGLLALIENKQFQEGFSYFKWLLGQRNDHGGFEGTQDTVVGLQALAKFAERISSKDNNVQIVVKSAQSNETHINVNPQNQIILQTFELPSSVRSIDVSATGKGFALLQLSYRYNLNDTDAAPSFAVRTVIGEKSNPAYINLDVCTTYKPKEASEKQSNMVVLEVSLPSGFAAESDQLYQLTRNENVKKVETKNGDTVFVVYFDSLKVDKEECLSFNGYRVYKVAEQKPVPIRVYDYYDSSRVARAFYSVPKASPCDICEGDDCSSACKKSLSLI